MTTTGTRIRFEEALAEGLRLEMHRDPQLVLITASARGIVGQLLGTFGSDRVIESDVAGGALVLAACGAAERGLRPVCELGPLEVGPSALDQVAELAALHAANLDRAHPLTTRLVWGDPLSAGGAAAADPLAWLIGADGIKVVAPATAADAKGLIVAAVRDDAPVCVLEHAGLRDTVDQVPEGTHLVPIGAARLAREGDRMTIVAHGTGVRVAQDAAERLELDADLLDLRTLQPLDTEGVLSSVRKTGRVLFAEAGDGANRITAQLISSIWEQAFEYLDAPPRRIKLRSNGRPAGHDERRPARDDIEAIKGVCSELLEF
jgi:pyruvate/2-oxoglutarate/acetoin dehydrogenase E1 component